MPEPWATSPWKVSKGTFDVGMVKGNFGVVFNYRMVLYREEEDTMSFELN